MRTWTTSPCIADHNAGLEHKSAQGAEKYTGLEAHLFTCIKWWPVDWSSIPLLVIGKDFGKVLSMIKNEKTKMNEKVVIRGKLCLTPPFSFSCYPGVHMSN